MINVKINNDDLEIAIDEYILNLKKQGVKMTIKDFIEQAIREKLSQKK